MASRLTSGSGSWRTRLARRRHEGAAWWLAVVALAALVLAPVLAERGYVLVGDMVFVPDQPWKPAWLGMDGGVPRAVPSDALTWAATNLLPGDLVQKAVLLAILVAAGVGTARLVDDLVPLPGGWRSVAAAAPALTLYVWNPFVYGRLAIGHWALLCGYAALPWVALLARRARDGVPGAMGMLTLPVAVAAWTSPTGGVLAAMVALAIVAGRREPRRWLGCAAVVTALNLPWLVPGLLATGPALGSTAAGVAAFAARADTPWGALGSLLSFGGLWKESIDAPARETWVLSGLAMVISLLGVAGLVRAARADRRTTSSLAVLAIGSLMLAWLPATGPGRQLTTWLVEAAPAAGILRDSQKWLAPFVLAVCVGLAWVARELLERWPGGHAVFWVGALAAVPVLVLPGLGWGLSGMLRPSTYPEEWYQVRSLMFEVGADEGRTVVLPFDVYRRFDWAADRAVLDPAPRFFPGDVVTDDSLPVEDVVVPGESRTAARIEAAVASGSAQTIATVLRDEGVGWVLVEQQAPGADELTDVGGQVLHDGSDLRLVELDLDETSALEDGGRQRAWVLLADAVALATLVAGLVAAVARRRGTYSGHEDGQVGGGP